MFPFRFKRLEAEGRGGPLGLSYTCYKYNAPDFPFQVAHANLTT